MGASIDIDSEIKKNLAYAYQILAYLKLDDHTYTHLSARALDGKSFYIYPFGLRFEEITPECLLKVSINGRVLEGAEYQYNKTGYVIHGSIYRHRPDINAIFHIHSPYIAAVSSMKCGLLPISQWALHFYDRIAYHDYDSLILDDSQSDTLIQDLGNHYTALMRNHGCITAGRTIHEAMFYSYHLEQACKTQILALSSGAELIIPSDGICKKAVANLLAFESDLGRRDWESWVRLIDARKASSAHIALPL